MLLTAKAKRALVELRRAERLERLESDELVEAAEVRRAIDGLIANAKSKLLALGHRLGPRVAIETDAGRCQILIDDCRERGSDRVSGMSVHRLVTELSRSCPPCPRTWATATCRRPCASIAT